MEVGLFVLGLLIGAAATWYLLGLYRRDDAQERDTNFEARLAALQDEVRQADAAHAETKDRLIALQMEQKAIERRTEPLEAELAQAKRAAEQAIEMEAKQRQACAALQDDVARLKRELPGGAATAPDPEPASVPAPAPEPKAGTPKRTKRSTSPTRSSTSGGSSEGGA